MAEAGSSPETLGHPIGDGTQYALHLKPIDGGTEKAPDHGYYASITKDAPLRLLQEQLGAKLGTAGQNTLIIYEGRTLDPRKGLNENSVTLPGAARRRSGVKLELLFDLSSQETLREREEAEQRQRDEEEAQLQLIADEQKRLLEEVENQRKEAERLRQERLKQERMEAERIAGEQAARFEGRGPPLPEPGAQMPSLNFRRLMHEYKKVQKSLASGEVPWLLRCEPVDDHLLCWELDVTFPEGSLLQRSLDTLATDMFDDAKNRVTLQARFPPEYPQTPPEVWLRKPRLKYQKGVGVTFGGKVCNAMLVAGNWNSKTNMMAVLEEIRTSLVDAGAEVDIKVSKKQDYPTAPAQLDRLRTTAFEKANDFEMPQMTVISGVEAATFLGDQTRLEQSDKIALPYELADRIYGRAARGDELEMPLMFEVKTRLGRKTHCTIFDFVQGLPHGYCMLPRWVMDDLFIDERDVVRLRGVRLPLCEYVKIQPHSLDFYDAVQKSGGDVQPLLLESIKRFSALTVETSVPIEIMGQTYDVSVLDLRPSGAVRVIDADPTREFEFPVEFVAAPDLEDEGTMKARQDEMIARFKAKQEEQERELRALEDRRVEAKARHFEAIRDNATAAAGADDGSEGDVVILLRLPTGQRKGKFRDGAPVAALVALALQSDWAAGCKPWGVTLRLSYPKRDLREGDSITKDMHNAAVIAQEVEAPQDDEELFAEAGVKAGLDADVEGEQQLPPMDDEELQRQTQFAFQVQCFIQAGCSAEEAVDHVQAGRPLPSVAVMAGPARPPPVPAARAPAPAPARDAGEVAARAFDGVPIGEEHLARPPEPGEAHFDEISMVIAVTGCTPYAARQMLQARGWNVETAVNDLLD